MPRRLRLIWIALLVVIALPATALGASSSEKAIWGPATWHDQAQFPLYRQLGVGTYQTSISWAAVAPRAPKDPRSPLDSAYQWPAQIDSAVSEALRDHMRVTLLVEGVPGWASGHRSTIWAPRHAADLGDFLVAAAHHYPQVHLWMIEDEASRKGNFLPLAPARWDAKRLTAAQKAGPRAYAQMLDAAYGALKAVNEHNVVIGGATYTTGALSTAQWIANLRLPNGQPPRMDLYEHNPFSWRAPNLADPPSPEGEVDFSDLSRLYTLVNRELARPHQHIRLYLGEWMLPTAPDSELNIYVTRGLQAQWITDAWRIVRHHSFIYALGWIHVHDDGPPNAGSRSGSQSGLLDWQGHPKPGYNAFRSG